MKFGYYPGCSLSSTGIEYNMSTKAVADFFGVQLEEIPDWNCCGASSAHATNQLLGLALPARNLQIAEEQGLDIAVPCAACYSRLKASHHAITTSETTKAKINEVIGKEYNGSNQVVSVIDVVHQAIGTDAIKEKTSVPLKDLKVASYYGCLWVRPRELAMDDPENPVKIDQIVAAAGAEPVEWAYKNECCGAGHSTQKTDVGIKMIRDILKNAKDAGADCIATACPLCMINLDMRQGDILKEFGEDYNLPIFYFTELVGMAIGYIPEEVGVNKHFVDALPLLIDKKIHPAGRRGA
ncbi:heterodisulfide reductase subunit B [Desulfitispora alkaliphila]|uniref:CoB--CoM heterodisulfide reductase iron-sulfur subunit B family protein n=1 Tax=Desulfitispora alkaliphila TaxID=622674 RepID=UPI003D1BDAB5